MRVGFLGTGLIATYHSKSLRRSGEPVERAGCYDPDPARAEAFARASGHHVCRSEEEVLDGCDAVYVCTWTSEHRRLAAAAAERGIAVFCEKPLGVDLADARALATTVTRAGVTNQVGLVLRHSPAFLWMRELCAHSDAGGVMSVVFRDDQYIPVQGQYASTWRGDVTKAGAGTMLEHSIHDVDMLEFLAGPVTSVSARSAGFHGLAGIEDTVAASLSFAGGAVGTLTSVWHDVLARPSLRRVEIFCRNRWIALEGHDWFGPVRWIDDMHANGAEQSLSANELVDATVGLIDGPANPDGAFVRAVVEGRPAWPDVSVALRAHEVVDAVYRSAAAGGTPQDC